MLFQVKELAQLCNVHPDTIRHYSRIGLLQPTRDPGNGYRQFTVSDTKQLNFIKSAQKLGFTLNEIKHILAECQKGKSPCPMVRNLIDHRIKVNRVRLEQLMELQIRMEQALADWAHMQDGTPGGDSICQLIESFGVNHGSTTSSQKEKSLHS